MSCWDNVHVSGAMLGMWTQKERQTLTNKRYRNDLLEQVGNIYWAKTPPFSEGPWKRCSPRPEDCIFSRGPEEKGGVFTLYTGFAGLPSFSKIIPVCHEQGWSWQYCKTLTHWSKPQKENSVYSEQREWRADDNFHPLIQTTKGE